MRIGIDVFQLKKDSAGIGSYLYNIIKQLEKLDKENEYFLYSFENIKLPFDNNILWHKRCYNSSAGEKGFFWYLLKANSVLKKDKIDVFWATQNIIFPFIPKRTRKILTMHDLVWYFMPRAVRTRGWFILRILGKLSLLNADYIICVSNATMRDIENTFVPVRNKKVVYNGIGEEFKKQDYTKSCAYIKNKFALESRFILCVSTLEPRKNYVRIIKSFSLFCNEHPELKEYKLLIVGKKGWKYKEVFDAYNLLDIKARNRIIFLHYIKKEDLIYLYSVAEALLFPSSYEGFGLPIVEAMACGCPVITSDISSMPEVAGDAAFFVDPYSINSIADAISKVLTDNNLREKMIEKGFENIKRFSWKKAAREVLEVFRMTRNIKKVQQECEAPRLYSRGFFSCGVPV